VLSASQARTGAITANGNVLALGNQPGFSEYFGGSLDEVRIWNIARTQVQIQSQMYNHLDPSTQTGLVANYTFNQGITAGTNTGMTTLVDMKNENNGTLSNFSLTGGTSNFVMQNATLPVDWLSFTAKEQNEKVRLEWSTAAEQNTKEFIVQHSVNGNDWKNIARVPAAGNSNNVAHYSYVHIFPNDGLNYYSIKQTDLDGRSSVSEIRLITLMGRDDSFVILKNPAENGKIDVKVKRSGVLLLYGIDGRLYYRKQVAAGIIGLSVKELTKGIYFLKSARKVEKVILK
jgi:hypothetical protein